MPKTAQAGIVGIVVHPTCRYSEHEINQSSFVKCHGPHKAKEWKYLPKLFLFITHMILFQMNYTFLNWSFSVSFHSFFIISISKWNTVK